MRATASRGHWRRRGVHKLDLPYKKADSGATADVTAYGTDHTENSEVDRGDALCSASAESSDPALTAERTTWPTSSDRRHPRNVQADPREFRSQALGLIWDSRCLPDNKNPRFTGVLGADDGTRTHDLLHGKRVVGSGSHLRNASVHAGWRPDRHPLGLGAIAADSRQFNGFWAQEPRLCPMGKVSSNRLGKSVLAPRRVMVVRVPYGLPGPHAHDHESLAHAGLSAWIGRLRPTGRSCRTEHEPPTLGMVPSPLEPAFCPGVCACGDGASATRGSVAVLRHLAAENDAVELRHEVPDVLPDEAHLASISPDCR
jgi:hypothetical protein